MFSFEGDFRRTPKEEKASLLHRTQEERRKREDERRRLKNSIIIQSYVRGFQERKQQYAIQRSSFDHCVCQCQTPSGPQLTDSATLSQLVRRLLFFYRHSEDRQRMIWMCQCLVKHHAQFIRLLLGPERQSCLFQIKRMLGHCCRQFIFSAFTEEFISVPFIEQIYHFFVPALSDPKLAFPFQNFLWSLQSTIVSLAKCRAQAPWLFYFVLSVGESGLGSLSEEGLLLYLNALQTLLPLLPVTECNSRADVNSDSEDEEEMTSQPTAAQDGRWLSVRYITEECVQKLDTKQQTNALLTLVWRDSASEEVFTMMASICHTLMVQHHMMVPRVRLLYSLAFNARFLRHLWYLITSMKTKMITGSMVPLLQVMSRGSPMSPEDSNRIIPLFYLFSSLFSHSLISVHDSEFFGNSAVGQSQPSMMPFSLAELVTLSRCLRDACLGIIKLAYPETKTEHREEYVAAFRSVGVKTNSQGTQLYVPSSRHVWRTRRMGRIGPLQSTLDVGHEPPPLSVSEERHLAILTELPFVVPFEERVKIFQKLIYADKREVQGEGPFLDGVNITIRRNYIYEDAYDKLSPENEPDLKKRIRVHLLNAHGLDEAGIDGGGIFREFLNELLKSGFNPNQGFFRTTNEGLLYPSPTAEMLVGESFTRHYYFLGRILGKV
ncbi:hypothetical protein DNTS_026130 [Danionella cerebrum]|uniref:HECT-type E3 ubiquitin transferase n=1 Tax=Danionella cerebrum TaxID=2873325 RepID=A0A553QFH3_9TELE|nr:hypothetical protein DNTS_026130 [Danionella translucida]